MKSPKKTKQKSGISQKAAPRQDPPPGDSIADNKAPGHPATDRSAALAAGLRQSHRDGDFNAREYTRQMQAITQEAAGIDTRESAG